MGFSSRADSVCVEFSIDAPIFVDFSLGCSVFVHFLPDCFIFVKFSVDSSIFAHFSAGFPQHCLSVSIEDILPRAPVSFFC